MISCRRLLWALVFAAAAGMAQAQPAVKRTEWKVQGEPGITLAVRHVAPASPGGLPIVLLHGARVPGIASFDLPVPGGSLAADLRPPASTST